MYTKLFGEGSSHSRYILIAYALLMEFLVFCWSITMADLVRSILRLAVVFYTSLAHLSELEDDDDDVYSCQLVLALLVHLLVDVACGLVRFLKIRHPLDRQRLMVGLSLVQVVAWLVLDQLVANAEYGLLRNRPGDARVECDCLPGLDLRLSI